MAHPKEYATKNMLEQTKCDGVMFARGAMGNPFIFNQTKDLLTKGNGTIDSPYEME